MCSFRSYIWIYSMAPKMQLQELMLCSFPMLTCICEESLHHSASRATTTDVLYNSVFAHTVWLKGADQAEDCLEWVGMILGSMCCVMEWDTAVEWLYQSPTLRHQQYLLMLLSIKPCTAAKAPCQRWQQ